MNFNEKIHFSLHFLAVWVILAKNLLWIFNLNTKWLSLSRQHFWFVFLVCSFSWVKVAANILLCHGRFSIKLSQFCTTFLLFTFFTLFLASMMNLLCYVLIEGTFMLGVSHYSCICHSRTINALINYSKHFSLFTPWQFLGGGENNCWDNDTTEPSHEIKWFPRFPLKVLRLENSDSHVVAQHISCRHRFSFPQLTLETFISLSDNGNPWAQFPLIQRFFINYRRLKSTRRKVGGRVFDMKVHVSR